MRTDCGSKNRMGRTRQRGLALLLFLALFLLPGPTLAAQDVLVLHSYNIGLRWTDDIMAGINHVFADVRDEVELHVEYMDTKRYPPEESFPFFARYIQEKYQGTTFDAVIISDNNALEFVLDYHRGLFRDAPVVFCGVNNYTPRMLRGDPNVTGVVEAVDVEGTVAMALEMLPSVRRLVAVNDDTVTGRANAVSLRRVADRYKGRVDFETLSGRDVTVAELGARLAGLEDDTAVLAFTFHEDSQGHYLSLPEFLRVIDESAKQPVFGFWEHYLDHGVLGGRMVSGEAQGRVAALIAMQILSGTSVRSIPVVTESPNVPMVDYAVLQELSLPESAIPEGAAVRNRPQSFYRENRLLVWTVAAAVVLQAVVILVLLLTMAARRRAEGRFRLMAEKMPILIHAHDEAGRVIYWNEACERVLGWTGEDIVGSDSFREKLYPDPAVRENIRSLHENRKDYVDVETPVTTKDGGVRYISWSDADRYMTVPGWASWEVGVDVTDRLEAERKNSLLARLLDESDSIAVFKNTALEYQMVNDGYLRLTGYSGYEDVIGKTDAELFDGLATDQEIREYLDNDRAALALPRGEILTREETLASDSEEDRVFLTKKFPIFEPGGDAPVGVATLTNEITQLKEIENKLRREKSRAEEANRAKSLFLANMSHELRTPLNGIMGMHQLLKNTNLDDEQAEWVELATQSSARLTRLLGDILDLSKVESGAVTFVKKRFDICQSLETVEQLFTPTIRDKGVSLSLEVDPAMPRYLVGDPVRFQQVVNNLVGNAIKFTEEGMVSIEASPLPGRDARSVRLLVIVSDTGIGIDPDDMDTLFEAFTQADQGFRRTHQGAGLGLSIVRELVRRMDGSLTFESEPGVGSAFYVCLPFAVDEDQSRPAGEVDEATTQTAEATSAGSTILLAEDDRVNRRAVRAILDRAGYKTTAVENGTEALAELERGHYDLVLMDVQMPVMDGVEATRAIRSGQAGAANRDVPVVALTAYAMDGDKARFLDAGMTDYLAKPVDADELTALLGRLLATVETS